MRNHAREFESAIWPAVCPIPCPPKDDDQYRHQYHQQIVKVELKRRLKPLKMAELIDQGHPLFIGKFLGREARQKHDEVGNRLQYIEKHLEPPLISSSCQSICGQYAGAAVRPVLQGVRGGGARRELKDCHIHV
jgi:hypothetical protein